MAMPHVTMMGTLEPFVPGNSFVEYAERLQQFFTLNDVPDNKKVASLITFLGPEAYLILKKLTMPENPSTKSYEILIHTLRQHFAPETNIIAERFKFHKEEQGQAISDYIVQLKARAQPCNYGNFLDEALRDRLVFGLRSNNVQAQLLKEKDLTFEKACRMATSWELAKQEIRATKDEGSWQISNMQRRKFVKQKQGEKSNNCGRCWGSHKEEQCFAKSWICNKCGKVGHLAKKCFSKEIKQGFKNYTKNNGGMKSWFQGKPKKIKEISEEEPLNLNNIKILEEISSVSSNLPITLEIIVEGRMLSMEIDTGTCATVISENLYDKYFGKLSLKPCGQKLLSVTGEVIKIIGMSFVRVRLLGDTGDVDLPLYIIRSNKNFYPLLGRAWLDKLLPHWRQLYSKPNIELIAEVDQNYNKNLVLDNFVKKYPKLIAVKSGEKIKQFKADIILKESAKPIFHKAYTVPFKMREKVEVEIERLCKEGILLPVRYSDWASPIVTVKKNNGNVRICMDSKVTINNYIVTHHYPLPRIDDMFAKLTECK